ncbi:hypothetical protein PG989_005803 [Apiospora arundinis]
MVNHEEHGQYAIDKIKKEAGEYSEIEWIPCNLGNLKEAKEILSNLRNWEEQLDLICINLRLVRGVPDQQDVYVVDLLCRHG